MLSRWINPARRWASRRPRVANGRSRSSSVGLSQLDFACRSTYRSLVTAPVSGVLIPNVPPWLAASSQRVLRLTPPVCA
jgi:hypothetical protein